ncbi:MAG: glycosyltransferase [Clostridiales bacterium]|nr:glycosyltransferase [Clostridiales bacterium]
MNYEFELLFVNDGSKDNTIKEIKELRKKDSRISYVDFSRNFGKEIAMIAGLDYATGDCVIIMDADLQDPPELIPQMVELWEQGYDDVYAKRKSRAGETWLKKFTSKMYYRVLQSLTKVEIQKDTGDFRLLDKRCVNALKKMRETGRCSKSMFSWIGYNKKEILYDRDPRIAGKTKWNYKKLIDLAIDGITSFTTSPLRISTYLSMSFRARDMSSATTRSTRCARATSTCCPAVICCATTATPRIRIQRSGSTSADAFSMR